MGENDLRRAQWRISSYSANGSTCVEVARNLPGIVAVRDSNDRHGPVLIFTLDEWRTFVTQFRNTTPSAAGGAASPASPVLSDEWFRPDQGMFGSTHEYPLKPCH